MTIDEQRLSRLGDALREAAAVDLVRGEETRRREARPRRRSRPRKRVGLAVAALTVALAVPAAAIATGVLGSNQEVADSIEGGIALPGAEPTCTTIRPGLEYECVVEPGQLTNGEQIEPGHWLGVVEGSMDKATMRVNGGCRSQDAEGTHWLCYIGQESVRQRILMPSALGQYMGGPPIITH
jgi:hypothetical protein